MAPLRPVSRDEPPVDPPDAPPPDPSLPEPALSEQLFAPPADDGSEPEASPDDPATATWRERTARLRARRLGRRQLAVLAGGVLAVDLALALVIPPLLPFLVFHRASPAAAGDPAPAAVAPAPAPAASPADRVLTQLVTDPALLPAGWSRVAATTAAYGSPYARACPSALPPGTTGVASRFVAGRGAAAAPTTTAVGLRVTALPAGGAALAVDRLRTWVGTCPGADGLDPEVVDGPAVESLEGADAFVARGGAEPSVTWVVWARGDLLVAASVTGLTSTAGGWQQVAASVDGAVQRHLRPVCRQLDVSADDALRNPTTTGYTPWAPQQQITVPPVDVVPDPPPVPLPPVTLPNAVAHPDLAPVLVPDPSTWTDTNGDGVGDTLPPVTAAPRGTAPVFRDPEAITVPDGLVTTAPVEPARPTVPPSVRSVAVPAVDSAGPGCGWGFTGGSVPRFDATQTADAAHRVEAEAQTTAAAEATTYREAAQQWQPAEEAFLQDLAAFTTWTRYDDALAEARRQLADAQSAYDASLVAYEAVASATPTTPPTTPPTTAPPPSPTTSPSPTTTPSPTGSSPTSPGPGG